MNKMFMYYGSIEEICFYFKILFFKIVTIVRPKALYKPPSNLYYALFIVK